MDRIVKIYVPIKKNVTKEKKSPSGGTMTYVWPEKTKFAGANNTRRRSNMKAT